MDFTQIVVTIVGSGLGTALVGTLFKFNFDRKLEVQRAFLSRASRVHEKQMDTLSKLHGHFTEIQAYLQLSQKGYVLEGEKTDEYPVQLVKSINHARDVLTFGRLLIPEPVAAQCDVFFEKVFESHREFAFSRWDMLQDGNERVKLREKATDLSYKVVPDLLKRIDAAARAIIHTA